MDPELFNSLADMSSAPVSSGSGYATVPTAPDLASAVDSSGNSSMPSLPSLGNSLQGIGSIFTAWGDITSGNESQAAYDYNASLALEQGDFEVQQIGLQEHDTLGTQQAMYAKAGVTSAGSPMDVAMNTATQFETDKQIATYNAQSKANEDIYAGNVAKQQGEFKADMALLSGAEDMLMHGLFG